MCCVSHPWKDKADPSKITNTQRIDGALPTIKKARRIQRSTRYCHWNGFQHFSMCSLKKQTDPWQGLGQGRQGSCVGIPPGPTRWQRSSSLAAGCSWLVHIGSPLSWGAEVLHGTSCKGARGQLLSAACRRLSDILIHFDFSIMLWIWLILTGMETGHSCCSWLHYAWKGEVGQACDLLQRLRWARGWGVKLCSDALRGDLIELWQRIERRG